MATKGTDNDTYGQLGWRRQAADVNGFPLVSELHLQRMHPIANFLTLQVNSSICKPGNFGRLIFMVANPKWPSPGGDGSETNFRNLLIFLFVVITLSVIRFAFELTSGMGFFSPAQW
ncbi:MAG: hypothetical protein AB7T14_02470 [Candidatus Methylacidiphilaceae bacterium]